MNKDQLSRGLFLASIAVFAMVGLAWTAATVAVIRDGILGLFDFAMLYATIVGVIVGAISVPFVCLALWRTNLARTVPLVYLPSLAAVAVWTWIADPWSAAIVALLAVIGMSIVARLCPRTGGDTLDARL